MEQGNRQRDSIIIWTCTLFLPSSLCPINPNPPQSGAHGQGELYPDILYAFVRFGLVFFF